MLCDVVIKMKDESSDDSLDMLEMIDLGLSEQGVRLRTHTSRGRVFVCPQLLLLRVRRRR